MLICRDHFFGDTVDIAEADIGHARRDGSREASVLGSSAELVDAPRQESPVTDSVRTDERDYRHTPLGQASGVFNRSGWCPDIVRRRPVFEHVEQSRHILLDTGVEQLLNDVVATQFRNVGSYELPDVVGHVEDVAADRRCHLRQLATYGVYASAHAVIVWRVSRPRVADSAADGGPAMLPTSVPGYLERASGWRLYA